MGGMASQQDEGRTPGLSAVWWVPPQKRNLPQKPFERPRSCWALTNCHSARPTDRLASRSASRMFLRLNAAAYPIRMFVERCADRIAKRIEIGAFL